MSMEKIFVRLSVNGKRYEREVEPRYLLADFLRHELGLKGTHIGCEHGVCGACTVLLDGGTARSCLHFAAAVDGAEITTVEGISVAVRCMSCSRRFTKIMRFNAAIAPPDSCSPRWSSWCAIPPQPDPRSARR